MGNCCSRCCSSFRAKFRPNQDNSIALSSMPRPPNISEVAADVVDGVAVIPPEVLNVKSVDLCVKINGEEHRTDNYELMNREKDPFLVVRRGQSFLLDIEVNRQYKSATDGISFIFTSADVEKPGYGQGTMTVVPLLYRGTDTVRGWSAVIDDVDDRHIKVKITAPSHCIIGQWKMDIDTKLKKDGAVSYSLPSLIYILFNPWCPQDQVYLDYEDQRQEYVLETSGLIWRGSHNRLRPVPWEYAQFEKDILDCALYLIRKVGKLSGNARSDPVVMSRVLSAVVNSPDDNGVVRGNWSDDHGSHTPPTKWVGSMKILQKYYKTKEPVKYGQCWVFSGVLTTICRALGIPTRTVTNYQSAHDTQSSLTVDYFVDKEGEVMEEMNTDSIWNFHVWNEVWMDRPDLGLEYGGWQAVDATPQELSEDIYRCGPASVAAVKRGEVLKPYDNTFVFAAVNADKIFWRYTGPTQPLKLLRKDALGIGQSISTKAVGKMEREDITSNYKFPEKTEEERQTMLRALRQSESLFARYYLNEDFNDIKFDFELRDDIKIGQPFSVAVIMKNRNQEKDYKVNILLRVDTVLYTGKVKDTVKKESADKVIKAGTKDEFRFNVTYEEYAKRLCDQCAFNIACLASVAETNFEYFAQDDFRVRKPDIKIKLHDTPVEEKECTAELSLENPLPAPLKKGQFLIEGPGLSTQLKIKLKDNVPVGGHAKAQFKFTPPRTGRHTITAKFFSKEIDDVDGYLRILVTPMKDPNGTLPA